MEQKALKNLHFMVQPEDEVIQALVNLENDSDFKAVLGWMLECSAKSDNVLRNAEPTSLLYRAQGAQSVLLEFCEYASSPREIMAKIKRLRAGIRLPSENNGGFY